MPAVNGECVSPPVHAPFMQKPISLVDTAFDLYGFMPDDADRRWPFLERYDELQQRIDFRRINFANAWGATYLSQVPSFRSGFVNTINPENCLQLERALDNLEYIDDVQERHEAGADDYGAMDMRLALTDRLTSDPTQPQPDETPCPEALYQVRLYYGRYLARIGFNLHNEDSSAILSIVNVQGTPGSANRNASFRAEFGISPFNILVQRALAIARAKEPAYETRGLINPAKGNSQLYWGTLTQENVEMYHAERKTRVY